MKVYYDDEVDALYIKLSDKQPECVIEVTEGLNIDTTTDILTLLFYCRVFRQT